MSLSHEKSPEGQYEYAPPKPRRRIIDRLLRWVWVLLTCVVVTACYLYGFTSNIVPESSEYIADVLRTATSQDLRIETLPPKFLPETGKHRQSGRLILIGDVHGMKTELEALLVKVEFDSQHDHLILTGDMIDKGPDSAGVIDVLMELGASCVMGNHEHKAIASQAKWLMGMGSKRIKWIRKCPHILKVGTLGKMGEVVVVHAGLEPEKGLKAQTAKHVMNMRTINKKGKPSSRKGGVDWFKRWNKYQKTLSDDERTTVIYGHNSGLGLQDHAYTKGLDTGCVNGGLLTALVIDGGQKHHTTEYVDVKCANGRQ